MRSINMPHMKPMKMKHMRSISAFLRFPPTPFNVILKLSSSHVLPYVSGNSRYLFRYVICVPAASLFALRDWFYLETPLSSVWFSPGVLSKTPLLAISGVALYLKPRLITDLAASDVVSRLARVLHLCKS